MDFLKDRRSKIYSTNPLAVSVRRPACSGGCIDRVMLRAC